MSTFVQRALSVEASAGVTLDAVKAAVPEDGKEAYGNHVEWQVYAQYGIVSVRFTHTFRRSNALQAFLENKANIDRANARLKELSVKFKPALMTLSLCTREEVEDQDRSTERDEGTSWSEYEQSINGVVSFKQAKA